jgi:hypothetical protein
MDNNKRPIEFIYVVKTERSATSCHQLITNYPVRLDIKRMLATYAMMVEKPKEKTKHCCGLKRLFGTF